MTDTIDVPVWYDSGGMLIRRSTLEPSHPESVWNFIKRNYPDVDPADFGAECPIESLSRCPNCGEELNV